MILCGCLGLGMWYRGQFLMRLHMTRELICLLDQWISEIRYNRSTLPEGCRQIGRQREDRLGEICNRVYREYAEAGGTGFLEIAGESFRRQLEALPLKKEEIDQFLITIQLAAMRQTSCPCKNGSNGICRCLFSLLVLAVMPCYRAVRGFGFHCFSVGRNEYRRHHAERSKSLRHSIRLHITIVILARPHKTTVGHVAKGKWLGSVLGKRTQAGYHGRRCWQVGVA